MDHSTQRPRRPEGNISRLSEPLPRREEPTQRHTRPCKHPPRPRRRPEDIPAEPTGPHPRWPTTGTGAYRGPPRGQSRPPRSQPRHRSCHHSTPGGRRESRHASWPTSLRPSVGGPRNKPAPLMSPHEVGRYRRMRAEAPKAIDQLRQLITGGIRCPVYAGSKTGELSIRNSVVMLQANVARTLNTYKLGELRLPRDEQDAREFHPNTLPHCPDI